MERKFKKGDVIKHTTRSSIYSIRRVTIIGYNLDQGGWLSYNNEYLYELYLPYKKKLIFLNEVKKILKE